MSYVIEMIGIRKEFPGIVANDDITIQLEDGEIHALLGENGAGKSTLMSVLFGLYKPEKGVIKVNGKEVNIANPNVANDLKIGMVHQHFKLVPTYTVTENIILGKEPKKFFTVDMKKAREIVVELSSKYGLSVDPDAKIEDISVGMQQRVEILKMLYRNADYLIFDEPTAVLTPQEIDELMEIMRKLIKEGKSIILITHKLKEIKAVADRCTVIRKGKCIGTVNVNDTSVEEMAEMMVGRKVDFSIVKEESKPGKPVLEIKNLTVLSNRGSKAIENFSLTVCENQIIGLAGVDGNGQTELVEAISGLRKIESGQIIFNGVDITKMSIRDRNELGLGHIPEDRHKHGLVLDFTLKENMVLQTYYKKPYSSNGILNYNAIEKNAEKIVNDFDVRSGKGIDSLARTMSGGNQQKAIVGREIENNPGLLLAVQPTRGLDIGAIEYIHKRLIEHRALGKAILLVSLELEEIFGLSDEIAVISHGELVDVVDVNETDEKSIGLMMAGVKGGNNNEEN